jgi:peptidoglycan/xylan/chitin deacetylase (PgdA/CDA1 family)
MTAHREFVGYGRMTPRFRWPGEARVAISIVVNFEEGAEQSPLYGDPHVDHMRERFYVPDGFRDMRSESIFEYGTRVGIWRLLDLFDRCEVPTTFQVSARAALASPEVAREIASRRHEAAGHGYRWAPQYVLDEAAERQEITRTVDGITAAFGSRPVGWCSRGPSPNTRDLLINEGGFIYDSDSYGDDLPYFVVQGGHRWLTIPYSFETNDMRYFRAPGHSSPRQFEEQLVSTFDRLHAEAEDSGRLMTLGLHLRYSGTPWGLLPVERFIQHAAGRGEVWFARREDIARFWLGAMADAPSYRS